jgi:hypothetical protein
MHVKQPWALVRRANPCFAIGVLVSADRGARCDEGSFFEPDELVRRIVVVHKALTDRNPLFQQPKSAIPQLETLILFCLQPVAMI